MDNYNMIDYTEAFKFAPTKFIMLALKGAEHLAAIHSEKYQEARITPAISIEELRTAADKAIESLTMWVEIQNVYAIRCTEERNELSEMLAEIFESEEYEDS